MKEDVHARFAPVLSSKAQELFTVLLDHVQSFSENEFNDIVCKFLNKDESCWRIRAPFATPANPTCPQANWWKNKMAKVKRSAPAPHQSFLAVCAGFEWGEVGTTGQLVLGDGFEGTLNAIGEDCLSERHLGTPYTDDIFSPIDIDLGDFYFRHPLTGQLCYQSEGCISEVSDSDDPVEIYLREMHCEIGLRVPNLSHRRAWLRDWDPSLL